MIQGTLDAHAEVRADRWLSVLDQTVNHAIVLTMVILGSKSASSGDVILPKGRDTT